MSDFKFRPGLGGGGEPPSDAARARDVQAKDDLITGVCLAVIAGCGLLALGSLVAKLFSFGMTP